MVEQVLNELRTAARTLRRSPGVTVSAIVCLTGAIAAATTVFAVVHGVVLRRLPFRHADRLVSIWGVNPSRDTVRRGFSWPDLQDLARATRNLDGIAAMSNATSSMTLTGVGDAVQIPTRIVSGNFFAVLGVTASIGATLTTDHDVPRSQPAVTISDGLWRARFGADPLIAGRAVTLDARLFVITGVAPRNFAYPPDAQMWVTVAHGAAEYVENRAVGWLQMIGRAAPEQTPATIRAELSIPFYELARQYHSARAREQLSVTRLHDELLGDAKLALWTLLAGVVIVLLVACINVGGLLLVRSAARSHDLAIRIALGASRTRIIGHGFADSIVLLISSSLAGVAVTLALVRAVRRFGPLHVPGTADIEADWRVLVFAVSLTGMAIVICASASVLNSLSQDVISTLRESGRTITRAGGRIRRLLAGSEIAFAVVLMVAASLVGRTFLQLQAVDVGFRADRVLAFDVPQPAPLYPDARASLQFANRLLPRIVGLPGVERAASVLLRPLWGAAGMDWPVAIEGQPQAEVAQNPLTNLEAVSPGYFETMEIPIVEGRDLSDGDENGRPPVAVVSQSFVKRFWPDGRALGRRIRFPLPGSQYDRQWFTIIGVVGDARYRELKRNRLDLYISAAQSPYPVHQFVVRTTGRPEGIVPAIRAEVRRIDPSLPIDDVIVLSDAVEQQIANPRLTATIFAAFAVTAAVLAALGLGTLVAWQVRLRVKEFGIRLALGAAAPQLIGVVMRENARVVALGVMVGIVGALSLVRFIEALLYQVRADDAMSLLGATTLALLVGLVSAYVPARAAARVDPMIALRQD